MNRKEAAQLATILKMKELLATLDTFGWTIEFWEFSARIVDKNRKVVAKVTEAGVEWEAEDENEKED